MRLVTTNFDRLFEAVIQRDRIHANVLHAPLLPVPKNRWDGLVYLHGLLTPAPTPRDLDRLVLSSGDFGLAYLTERWAARFVSELFRNYTVCFVGYSINDPVLRYMMDALAADRLLGESPPEMFAFGSHAKGKEEAQEAEWRAKNVTPILYREHHYHLYLHRTLHAWASTYRDGVGGKEQIIVQYANSQPQHSTKEEDFVGRVLWALSHKSGLPALRFADIVPAPPFDWIESFIEPRFGHDDLARFGVAPLPLREELQALKPFNIKKLEFSLLDRPAPYLRTPYMTVVRRGVAETLPDDVMRHLARWLLRYLDEPKLILWLAKRGGNLRDFFADLIERRLSDIGKWERQGDTTQIDELRRQSPKAIPRALLRPIWRLLLTGRVRAAGGSSFDLYEWFDCFRRDGLTASLRLNLRGLLAPRITLREPFRAIEEEADAERLKLLVDWELVLSTDHVHSLLRELNVEEWRDALPALIDDFTTLLRDALDIMAELGAARSKSDLSYLFQPSISEHEQNRDFYDWTALIELTRDAWLATADRDANQALSIAAKWWSFDYPLFRRLTFFAGTRDNVVPVEQALDWLLASNGWWLWSTETKREAMQLLGSLAPRLDAVQQARLNQAIQAGPPREMFRDDVEEDRWDAIVHREVWQRMAKLQAAGMPLDQEAQARLDDIVVRHREWHLAANEQDEFPVWMGQGDDWRRFETTPRRRRDLMQWLREHPDGDGWEEDDWAERCRKDFATTSCTLFALARENFWPTARWQRALHAWSEERLRKISWKRFASFFMDAPDPVVSDLAHGIGGWLQAVSKVFEIHAGAFFVLCGRVLSLSHENMDNAENADSPVTAAINHPVGYVTQALLDWWYRRDLQNNQGLPPEIEPFFTRLCATQYVGFRHGRVLLAAHAINLFLIDRRWFDQHLLPLFDWHRSKAEARAVWEGFFWSPRLVRSHLAAIKPALLETARHYDEIGDHARQYAAFLTHASLDRGDTFSVEELREAFRVLPEEGLAEAASALARGIEGAGAGEQRSSYWTRRVAPFWKDIWPKTANPSPTIADDLFRLCIAAGPKFSAALATIRSWLVPVPFPGYLLRLLLETDLCSQFPETSLEWLYLLMDNPPGPMQDLRECLRQISQASSATIHDHRYQELDQLCRQHGC